MTFKRFNTTKEPNDGFNKNDTIGKTSYNKQGASIAYDASSIISRTSMDDELTLPKNKNSDVKQVRIRGYIGLARKDHKSSYSNNTQCTK